MNSFGGWYNLPAQSNASSSEAGYLVPAAGAYAGLPAPTQVAANILVLPALPGDVAGGALDLGRPFRVRVSGEINSKQSENITIKLYQVTNANFVTGFTSVSTGTAIASTGAMATGAALKFNFFLESVCQWDAQSTTLNSYFYGLSSKGTPAIIGPTIQSNALTTPAYKDLNFYFTITGGTNTGNIYGPFDFTIERF